MSAPIVHSLEPITLIGGGEVGKGDLTLALDRAPVLVAADGGAQTALTAGHVPVAVIGDLDSLSETAKSKLPADRLFEVREQDSTDFDKALRHICAPLVYGVGFLGARVDHQLAAFNTLLRLAERPCVLIGQTELVFHVPSQIKVNLKANDIVSLFPMMPVTGRSNGLEWPIGGLTLAPGGRIGTSNRAAGPVRLDMDGPGLLMITPRSSLDAVTQALVSP